MAYDDITDHSEWMSLQQRESLERRAMEYDKGIGARKRNKGNAKTMLKMVIPMWLVNCALFITCLFMQDYAEHNKLWYESALEVLVGTFGTSKGLLTLLLLWAVIAVSFPSKD